MMWLKNPMDAARRRPSTPIPTQVTTASTMLTPTAPGMVRYRLTDPGTTQVVKEESFPTVPVNPPIRVIGLTNDRQFDTPSGQAAGVYMTINNTIRHYNEFAEKPHDHWTSVTVLGVVPRAGRQFNAYYDRIALAFFFSLDPGLGRDVFTSDSPDIVAHELGHALLDALRPDFWNTANLEVWAFHECYGDMMSLVSALQHPEIAQLVLDITEGNLRKDNPLSCLAEQMGQAVYNSSKNRDGMSAAWLRNAHNDFKYISPITLPDDGLDNQIIAEPHSFSRIMTGALYDCLETIYKAELVSGRNPLTALMNAGKGVGWYITRAAARVPLKGKFFQSFAETMLDVDYQLSDNFYHDRFKWIFHNRLILPTNPKLILDANQGTGKTIEVRLSDCLPLRAMTTNPLYNVRLEIPDDGLDSVLAAQDLVQYLHRGGLVSDSHDTPFQISDGKLERTHFACCLKNWENPTQPEYSKPPKPENHFQHCGCRNSAVDSATLKPPKIIREANVRYKNCISR